MDKNLVNTASKYDKRVRYIFEFDTCCELLLSGWSNHHQCILWRYGLWSFQTRYTKLERFLHKNQHAQGKLLNFENWMNGEPQ